MGREDRGLLHYVPTARDALAATASAATAALLTNPLEVVKSHQQLRHGSRGLGMVGTGRSILAGSGPSGFAAGIVPYMAYCCAMNGTRFVIFSAVKKARGAGQDAESAPSLAYTLAISVFAGAVGALVSNPLNVVRVRLQAVAAPAEAPFLRDPHRGLGIFARITREASSLAGAARRTPWAFGLHVQLPRLALASGAQLSTYEFARAGLHAAFPRADAPAAGAAGGRRPGWRELCASFAGGAAAVAAMTPFDTLSTRFIALNGEPGAPARGGRARRGALAIAARLLREEGPRALWKGATPLFYRVGPSSAVNVLLWEWLHTLLADP